MALLAELLKHVAQGGAGPKRRGAVDAETLGELVGGVEADAPDIAGQPVGVVAHQVDGLLAVLLVDAHGPRGADAVRLQEDHDLAHGLLFAPAFADLLDAARADSLDLLEEGGA